ncbi:DUF4860 domain-containing protein [Eubacterium sp.]|uniref:DUF4860 domain-containing protein n=1 Tax=Eubacterium sp. TaxID=142586 RepID=UPI002FC66578
MKIQKSRGHVVDYLFVLALFFTFALCTFTVIFIGIKVYSQTVSHMNENYVGRTATTYVTQKIRSSNGPITITTVGDAQALSLTDDDTQTRTLIYAWQGTLKELTIKASDAVTPGAGQEILPVDAFVPTLAGTGLLELSITDGSGRHHQRFVAFNP